LGVGALSRNGFIDVVFSYFDSGFFLVDDSLENWRDDEAERHDGEEWKLKDQGALKPR
jgi:hypothetical protein